MQNIIGRIDEQKQLEYVFKLRLSHQQQQQMQSEQNPQSTHMQQVTQAQNGGNNKSNSNRDSLDQNSSSLPLPLNDLTIARAHEQPQSFHQTVSSNGGAVVGASSLPPLTSNRSMIVNNMPSQQDYSQVEQRRVFRIVNEINVTITQVGNNVISSKIDISKQMVNPDEMMNDSENLSEDLQQRKQQSNNNNGLLIDSFSQNHVTQGKHKDGIINQQNSNAAKTNPDLQIPIPSSLDYTTNPLNVDRNQNVSPSQTSNKLNEKYKKFDPRSLYIFSYTWRFRQIFIDFLSWKYYDYIMVLSIIGNSIVLALADYTDEDNLTVWNQRLDMADRVFTIIYLIEAAVKIVAFGFIIHRKSYLRDPWNVIDFVVVVIGIISLVPDLPNLKSLRILRIFRPLRSINAVPSIKRLVATLLMSLPQMGYLVSFLLFFITIFAILGIQLFARNLYRRCRLTDAPIIGSDGNMSWPIDPTQVRPCGGYYQCQDGTYCHALLEKKLPLSLDGVKDWDYIQNGYFQFDNLGAAIMAIFRLITLEGWTYFMYFYMDSSGFIAGIYFPVLIVMGSFFFLNLFLAVITDTFSEMVKLQQQQEHDQLARLNGTTKKAVEGLSKDEQVSAMINVAKKKAQISGGIGNLSDAAIMFLAKAKEEQKREKEENEMIQASMLASQKEMKSYSSNRSDNALAVEAEAPDNQAAANEDQNNKDAFVKLEVNGEQSKEVKREAAVLEVIEENDVEVLHNTRFSKFQKPFHIICNSLLFILIINVCIISNTACLGLDYYPVNVELSSVLDKVNIGFFVIFFMEMIIKVIGLGPNTYIKDPYNIFDALIVTLSIIDVFVSATLPDDVKMGKGAISVFRAFRLLRVFKLAKSWKQLNKLIQTIAKSLKDISSFSILLFLLMFIYVLLGMQLFADKNHDQGRVNFKNFFNGFVLIFTVLTGENWDSNMFIFVKSFGPVAIVYFFTLIIIGQMIFMNVFQAILLENFENGGNEDEESKDEQGEEYLSEVISNFFSESTKRIKEMLLSRFTPSQIAKAESGGMSAMMSIEHSQQFNDQNEAQMFSVNQAGMNSVRQLNQKPPIQIEQFGSQHNSLVIHEENVLEQQQRPKVLQDVKPFAPQTMRQELALNFQNSQNVNFNEGQGANHFSQTQRDLAIGNNTMYLNNLGDISNAAGFSLEDTAQISLLRQYNKNASVGETIMDIRGQGNMTAREGFKNTQINQRDNTTNAGGDSVEVKAGIFGQQLLLGTGNMQLNKSQTQTEFHGLPNIAGIKSPSKSQLNAALARKDTRNNFQDLNESRANMSALSGYSPNTGNKPGQVRKQETKSIALILLQKSIDRTAIERNLIGKNVYECEGNSLYFFGPRNKFRCYVDQMVKGKPFDYFILLLIAFSSVNLALDNPLNNPNSTLTDFLLLSDYVLTSFFIGEGVLKIISQGFLLNGEGAYLKNGWNIIDFLVVIISVVSITVTGNKYKFVKIFRLLRILRPLRVVSKNKGLRIGIQALIVAIPRLFNVTIISLLFFIICGIIGVNYFKGTFYTCIFGPQFPDDQNKYVSNYVTTKFDCLNLGGTWMNADQNFDNLPQAISTLFQMSTTEGWIDVMNRGIDAVGPDLQPIQEYNVYWSLFFMVFIFFGTFLILNLFTGVVCDTYNSEKEILGKNYLLSENQKKWLEYKKMCIALTPKFVLNEADIGKFNITIYKLVTNKKFELFTLGCIMLNTVTLCINWYSQSVRVDDLLDYINYGFAGIFLIEALLKLTAFGFRAYFRETGNIFDLVIVLSSIVSTIVSLTLNVDFGSSTTFIRALRMTRIFKFIKEAKGMKVIFDTLIITVPAITNIGGLLLLLLFMFSILGIFLFADVKLQNTLDDHANFQSFGLAFLTLLRCSTGEAWNQIMQDAMRQKSILFQCSEDEFDYDTYAANGYQTQGCGSPGAGMAFFMAYFLLIPLFFLDIFVAIIIEGFEQSSNKANNLIQEDDYEHFRDCWVKFDQDGTGFISIPDFFELMFMMGEPLGWGPEYKNNVSLQNDFLEELNIPTYNNFKDFLFFDVVQALTKVYLVNVNENEEESEVNENQGLGSMPDEDGQDSHRPQNVVVPLNGEQTAPANPQGSERKFVKRSKYISHEEKVERRIELEFEELFDDKQDVMEVEEIRKKYKSLMKGYLSKQDLSLTSAHIKAGRKILEALRRLYKKKHHQPHSQNHDATEAIKRKESEQFVLKEPKINGFLDENWEIEEQNGLKLRKAPTQHVLFQINKRDKQ